ncbi:MAG: hypothetical protein ACKVP7_20245 [Hyphomicrobiaceae bacterium]
MRLALSTTVALALLAGTASAQGRYHGDYVVAESRYGKGTVSGPVRPGRHGWQVRLPGGSWVDCARSCSETLRRQSVDFWESNGPQSQGGDSPGYFRFRF